MSAAWGLVNRGSRMAGREVEDRRRAAMRRASALVSEALDLIDGHDGPAEAAAHLDLALEKLRESPPV